MGASLEAQCVKSLFAILSFHIGISVKVPGVLLPTEIFLNVPENVAGNGPCAKPPATHGRTR